MGKQFKSFETNEFSYLSFYFTDGSVLAVHSDAMIDWKFPNNKLYVSDVLDADDRQFTIIFSNASKISISLIPPTTHPEMFVYQDADGSIFVEN